MSHLTDDIRTLRGVGEKKAQLFHKLGLFTLGDCLEHFPREYEDRSRFYPIAQALWGKIAVFWPPWPSPLPPG